LMKSVLKSKEAPESEDELWAVVGFRLSTWHDIILNKFRAWTTEEAFYHIIAILEVR
jgi:hypothetical protein